ncbi:hypothetical protein OROGR_015880 [Orobanche gracilis]
MSFSTFVLNVLLIFVITYTNVAYSSQITLHIINDLPTLLSVSCETQNEYFSRFNIPPKGGIGNVTVDPEYSYSTCGIGSRSLVQAFSIFIDADGVEYCRPYGCFWSVRGDGMYYLINGHYVFQHAWIPD